MQKEMHENLVYGRYDITNQRETMFYVVNGTPQ